MDTRAVQSTGSGHGTTILAGVGKTPVALIAWLAADPDFEIVPRRHPRRAAAELRYPAAATAGGSASAT